MDKRFLAYAPQELMGFRVGALYVNLIGIAYAPSSNLISKRNYEDGMLLA